MRQTRRWLVLATGLALCGCNAVGNIAGLPATPEKLSSDVIASANLETAYIQSLTIRAGLTQIPGTISNDWRLIQRAGIRDIDARCDEYLDALFRFNRGQQAVRRGLTATAATTGTILAIANAGATAFGIVTAAFGLSASLFDAGANSVLFTIEPSALRNVVLEGRSKYASVMAANPPTTRPDTMIQLQGYLAQCSPAAIEANINNAANGSRNAVTHPDPALSLNAARLAGPAIATGTPRERAAGEVRGAVNPAPAAPPVSLPDTKLEGEAAITFTHVARVQAALGLRVTGLLGPEGSETRRAIREFEAGMRARNEPGWGEPSGRLTGRTADTLITLGPMPAGMTSPFERGFLTNATRVEGGPLRHSTIEEARIAEVWTALELPGRPPASAAETWTRVRPAIRAKRDKVDGVEKGVDSLDSQLWSRIRP
ncbi:MAG TPA: hypothetical protein VJ890_26890 [Vineibacter sp.]|nr:hypothetical protein [Vineibacter sp.]